MDIVFAGTKLRKLCTERSRAARTLGPECAGRLGQRLDELRAASTLEVMRRLPGRCHELRGDRAGQLSLDLVHPARLLFVCANEPPPSKPDGGLDWARVTAIRILAIEDTHE